MTPETITTATAFEALIQVRERGPLVHNITNYVAMTVSANALLALGASPAMVHAPEEVEGFTAISSSLVINIGTLSPAWVQAMTLAARRARELAKPWVLDPVGVGATPYRRRVCAELLALEPSIIRGNASEIMSLASTSVEGGKGVDSTAASEASLHAALALARSTNAVVLVTGAVDYATDGKELFAITGGDSLMTRSTALGCALSAITAAFAAVTAPLAAGVAALAIYGAAGKLAASKCTGPGHLPAELCDALYALDREALERYASVSRRPLP